MGLKLLKAEIVDKHSLVYQTLLVERIEEGKKFKPVLFERFCNDYGHPLYSGRWGFGSVGNKTVDLEISDALNKKFQEEIKLMELVRRGEIQLKKAQEKAKEVERQTAARNALWEEVVETPPKIKAGKTKLPKASVVSDKSWWKFWR